MTTDGISQIAVIGAGLMGHGIAQEFASAGYHVLMHDVTDEQLQTARTQIEKNLKMLAENAIIEKDSIPTTLQRIQTNTEIEAVAGNADFVVEAVIENLALKQQVFEKLDAICPPHAILASNTTALMPSQIGVNTKRKDKILNTHYFNPPYLIPLVELIRSPDTSDETVTVIFELLTAIGKTPAIIEKEVPGFVGPRLQAALIREAFAIVEQGIASAETVDLVVRNSFGRRLSVAGPFEVFELAGWDLVLAAFEELYKDLNSSPDINPLLRQMVESGKLGVKSQEGFYNWTDEKIQQLRDRMNNTLIQQAKMFKVVSTVHKVHRLVLLLALLIGLIVLGIYRKQIWEYLLELTAAFQSIETARAYIASYGALAPVVSAILMVFQSVIAPLPAFLITFANGTLFGFWWGSLLSWSSSMVGAALCFYIARALGIQRVTQLISQPAVDKANDFVEKYGTYAILIARLIPLISFDVVSYFAGATRMRFLGFWIATGIGQLPATLVYSYLGESASPHIKWILFIFGIVIAISIIRWLMRK